MSSQEGEVIELTTLKSGSPAKQAKPEKPAMAPLSCLLLLVGKTLTAKSTTMVSIVQAEAPRGSINYNDAVPVADEAEEEERQELGVVEGEGEGEVEDDTQNK